MQPVKTTPHYAESRKGSCGHGFKYLVRPWFENHKAAAKAANRAGLWPASCSKDSPRWQASSLLQPPSPGQYVLTNRRRSFLWPASLGFLSRSGAKAQPYRIFLWRSGIRPLPHGRLAPSLRASYCPPLYVVRSYIALFAQKPFPRYASCQSQALRGRFRQGHTAPRNLACRLRLAL